MVLLAGFNLFLHRVAGQHAIVTGIPVTGRSVAGSERLAGYCTHLLPLRSTLPEQATVASFPAGTRQNLLDALEHGTIRSPSWSAKSAHSVISTPRRWYRRSSTSNPRRRCPNCRA